MSDYDDYFTDDVLLDDQTLAILDREERKYMNQTNNNASPPPKRQRTNNGWTARIGLERDISNANETLPEISIQQDGSYGVLHNPSQAQTPTITVSSSNPSMSIGRFPTTTTSTVTSLPSLYRPSRIPDLQGRPYAFQEPTSNSSSSPVKSAPRLVSPIARVPSCIDSPRELQRQLQQLQRKLEQISQENGQIQLALKEAHSMRMAKEGEVTVLRKNAEKLSKDHAAQVSQLSAAREEAEAKQARMQKEMKEEVERLKTQFVFKQHEQESARKFSPSVRPKGAYRDSHPLITYTPLQSRQKILQESPSSSRSCIEVVPAARIRPGGSRDLSSSQTKRLSTLPGFQNAFSDHTPLSPSKKRPNRGKQDVAESHSSHEPHNKRRVMDPFAQVILNNEDVVINATKNKACFQLTPIPEPDGDFVKQAHMSAEHEDMRNEVEVDMEEGAYFVEVLDWKREMNRIILMHCFPLSTTLTIQLLLGVHVTAELGETLSQTYISACTRLLEVIANVYGGEDWQYTVQYTSQSLVSMVPVLEAAHLFLPLAALLNLLTVLIYTLPDFGLFTLSQSQNAQDTDAPILVHLCTIILEYREIEKYPSYETLMIEIVRIMGAFSLVVGDEVVDKLAYIPKNPQVLLSLFSITQSGYFIAHNAQLLVLLASHRKLCRRLLSMPDTDLPTEQRRAEPQKIPIIERLCLYLVDTERKDVEHKDTKTSILTFFSLLSISEPDVHTQLVASTTVIPSLVFLISQLTTAIWEDDEDLLSASPDEIALVINILNQTIFLLHYMVFAQTPFLNIRQKIYAPHHRLFNGLLHMFIVTFGRLSYGEAPEWINRQGRIDLVSSTELARDILDHVVDGPEADLTWQAYQIDGEEEDDMDEKMEEDLLGKRM